jgi:hypothetical protein
MQNTDLSWTPPIMRAGYAGRGLVYLVLAGFSLYAIWRGGQAESTGSALEKLEGTPGGQIVLAAIALGMLAYALWRAIDSIWDLEVYGTDGKGLIARTGMIVTGLIHLGIGFAAAAVLFSALGSSGGGSGGSSISEWTGKLMKMPMGRYMVGAAGLATTGAGIYYAVKAYKRSYREHLRGNRFTQRWDWVLRLGVLGQSVVVTLIGVFLLYAAITADPGKAGGVKEVFDFLGSQAFGQALVVALCAALLCFAIFCFVNAAYRIIPKVDDDVPNLASRLKAEARAAAS